MKYKRLVIKQVEEDLGRLIDKLNIGDKISVAWVKDFTYNFNAPDSEISKKYFKKLFGFLPQDISEKDFEKAMKVFNDVWNAFPQKVMGGISPQDKMLDATEKEKELVERHFEDATNGLDQYMDWAFKEVIPKYKESLKKLDLCKDSKKESVGVAEVFLNFCGHIGMFDFRRISPDFFKDFPLMFEKTVIGPKISKTDVAKYLREFLSFLDVFYGIKTYPY